MSAPEKTVEIWKKVLDFSGRLGIIIPVLDTQRISVTVAHRTLTPFAGVRIPHPLPITPPIFGGVISLFTTKTGVFQTFAI